MSVSFTVSARKSNGVKILDWLADQYPYEQIDSVFGFAEFTPMYGGRPYWGPELGDKGIVSLYDAGIGYRIPLTNHFITAQDYRLNRWFLDKHHRLGNTIIAVNDDFAGWVKNDYPDYEVEASAIKKLDTEEKINTALELFDSVVLPASCNDDKELLKKIKEKHRIRLFARAGCAYTCPSRICYKSFSKHMKDNKTDLLCSMSLRDRQHLGVVDFDINEFTKLGYSKFKSVPRN